MSTTCIYNVGHVNIQHVFSCSQFNSLQSVYAFFGQVVFIQEAASYRQCQTYGVGLLLPSLFWSHNENLVITVMDAWHTNTLIIEKETTYCYMVELHTCMFTTRWTVVNRYKLNSEAIMLNSLQPPGCHYFELQQPNHLSNVHCIVPKAEGSMYVNAYTMMAIGNSTTPTFPYKT